MQIFNKCKKLLHSYRICFFIQQNNMGIRKNYRISFSSAMIRLTQERWNHIINRHPELEEYESLIKNCLKEPDEVFSDNNKDYIVAKNCQKEDFITDWLVIYIRMVNGEDGFIKTLHGSSEKKFKRGKRKWQQVK